MSPRPRRCASCSLRLLAGAVLSVLVVAVPGRAAAQTGENVLVVTNASSAESQEIADYYALKRAIPREQVLRLEMPGEEEVPRFVYQSAIEAPIQKWLTANAAQDRILYIVLTKDVPLRIAGSGGPQGTVASVDSELTLLYRRLAGSAPPTSGPIANPYFADEGLEAGVPFSHRDFDLFLVTRLDGYSVDDVKALIDRGTAPGRTGSIVLDGRLELVESVGNRWLSAAADALRGLPEWEANTVLDTGGTVLQDTMDVLGYYSWGSNDRTAGRRSLNIGFVPGALAAQFVSTDARTFQEPPDGWLVNDRPFRGSHQSLIGDLIRSGITGVAGHVAEPYLNATIRPDILFPAYVSGFNLAESFYRAMPALSWQTVVVGDPLCAPFREHEPSAEELSPPLDETTHLPAFLSERRKTVLLATGLDPEAVSWMARADVHRTRDDVAGEREALERTTAIDPDYLPAHLALARSHEFAGEWDEAIDRYHQILKFSPGDTTVLNNLAYTMATKKADPAGALPFARRAYNEANSNPAIMDTLAWIYHLLGQDLDAEPLATRAANLAPSSAEIQYHAAAILAGRGKFGAAKTSLNRALRLDPQLADDPDVQALRKRLD